MQRLSPAICVTSQEVEYVFCISMSMPGVSYFFFMSSWFEEGSDLAVTITGSTVALCIQPEYTLNNGGFLQGQMPALLSHYRPDSPIYAFTENRDIQRRLALYHGITALYMPFTPDADQTFDK